MSDRKLFSAASEKRAIKTLCEGTMASAILAASLTEEHFVTDIGLNAFKRIKLMQRKRNVTLKWDDLLEDPGLSATDRSALAAFKAKPVKTKEEADHLTRTLNNYRRARGLKALSEDIMSKLRSPDNDVEDILTDTGNKLATVNIGANGFNTNTVGKGGDGLSVVKRLLRGESHRYLPTGFSAFDARNHGIAIGSLFMIAATTGGGKSVMLNKLMRNFALQGAKVGMVPLEMDNDQLMARTMSEVARVEMEKLINPRERMTAAEKRRVIKAYKKLERTIARRGGSFEMIQPDEDVDIETLLMYAKPKGLDVVIVDYVGLLKGADGDDQPKALSRITRYCKRWAEINKCIVVLAAQLSDEGIVRYSRAMVEHSSNMWQWVYSSYSRENKVITVSQTKARNQAAFNFNLYFDPAFMEMRDLTPEEEKALRGHDNMSEEKRDRKFGGKNNAKKKSPENYFANI